MPFAIIFIYIVLSQSYGLQNTESDVSRHRTTKIAVHENDI